VEGGGRREGGGRKEGGGREEGGRREEGLTGDSGSLCMTNPLRKEEGGERRLWEAQVAHMS
jgi:hypothetical protein